MKFIKKLLFMGAMVCGLAACSNDEIDADQSEGGKANTHVSVTLSMSTKGTRAGLPEDYNYIGEWAGKDKINTITVYLVDGTSVNSKTFNVGTGEDYEASSVNGEITLLPKRESAAIKTTAGQKKVYVLVNGAADVVSHLNKTPVAEFEDAYQQIALKLANQGSATVSNTSSSKLAKVEGATAREDVITMTNVEPKTIEVAANVTALETIAAGSTKNRVSLNVERAVARVMVTIADKTSFTVPVNSVTDPTPLGTITNVTWVLAQGENSLFVQRKADWSTPNYGWVPGVGTDDFISQAGDKYDYSGLFEGYVAAPSFGGTTVATYADYSNAVSDGNAGAIGVKSLDGKFILATTHAVGVKSASKYKKGNTAYVLVRAHFTPAKAAYADGGEYVANADFFVGANGKFYTSVANAIDPTKGGVVGQTVAKYVGGKVLYYAWVNPDDLSALYNSPVLRNNIYHIHITGFKNLGTNWNPLFPEDPDNPKTPGEGGNPDPKPDGGKEPVNPIDPTDPLTPEETWMSVDVKVLPWKVHSYSIDLGM